LAPPAIIVKNPVAKLQVDPTLQGPPELKLPQSKQIGDLLAANNTIPSHGIGGNGGMGSNHGTGIGTGNGPGFGSGTGGGCCSGAFRPGNGVLAPRAIYDPDPEYSEEARKAKYQGTVVLAIVVDPSGRPRGVRVARSLGMGLDQKAVEAVEKWKFMPGVKDGVPVAVQVNVEVSFRLY
jgi:TonB family protein